MQFLKARGCGYTVVVGDEDILRCHEASCPKCKDPVAVREQLKLARAKARGQSS